MINRPEKSKILLILIAVLLLANIGGLAYFFMNKSTHKNNYSASERKNAMAGYLKNDIGFSPAQLAAYDSLSEQHRKNMMPLFEQLKKEKENRLKYVAQFQYADTAIATAVSKAALQQQMVETKMLLHLKEVRNLCNEEQKIKFDSSVYKMFGRKGGDRKKQQ
jgi:flagellar basal body-associated protein FliL